MKIRKKEISPRTNFLLIVNEILFGFDFFASYSAGRKGVAHNVCFGKLEGKIIARKLYKNIYVLEGVVEEFYQIFIFYDLKCEKQESRKKIMI